MEIKTIRQLQKHISHNFNFSKVKDFLKLYNGNDWKQYIVTDSPTYFKNKIFENENYEIYIITWNPKEKTKIHDHADNGCFLKILQGELEEQIYDSNLKHKSSQTLKENNISFMNNNIGYHSISNTYYIHSVSIHIYSPPNHSTIYIN